VVTHLTRPVAPPWTGCHHWPTGRDGRDTGQPLATGARDLGQRREQEPGTGKDKEEYQ